MKKVFGAVLVIALFIAAAVLVSGDYQVKDLTSGNSLEYITSTNEYRMGNHLKVSDGLLDAGDMTTGLVMRGKGGRVVMMKSGDVPILVLANNAADEGFTNSIAYLSAHPTSDGMTLAFTDKNTTINGGTIKWDGNSQIWDVSDDDGNNVIRFKNGELKVMKDDGASDITLDSANQRISMNGQNGITTNSTLWMCSDASCNTTCQVQIVGGIIIGCV